MGVYFCKLLTYMTNYKQLNKQTNSLSKVSTTFAILSCATHEKFSGYCMEVGAQELTIFS